MPRLQSSRYIARGAPLRFQMDGESFTALQGETIAAALIASGHLNFKRDRRHQPRGFSCGMGVCFECEVSVDGAAPTRACLTKVQPDMQVRSVDYRKLPPDPESISSVTRESIDCEVLVVGAGPAGLSAAIALADAGIAVTLVDERAEPGGQFFKPLAASQQFATSQPTDTQYRNGAALTRRLAESGVRVMGSTTLWGVFQRQQGGVDAGFAASGVSGVISARQIVLAAGAFEPVPAFPGWTLPGVMTTGAGQGLVRSYRVAPGDRVLIAGNGPLNLQLACELLEAGVQVVAVAESARAGVSAWSRDGPGLAANSPPLAWRGARYLATLKRHGVPLLYGHHMARATGEQRVAAAVLAAIQDDGRLRSGTERHYPVDAVCLGYGLQSSNELARLLGCRHITAAPGCLVPERDDQGQTDIPGVYIVGDSGALGGAHVAQAEGRIAASAIITTLRGGVRAAAADDRRLLRRHRRFQQHLWSFYRAPEYLPVDPEALLCRCESVTLGEVHSLITQSVTDAGSIKRRTRLGMGSCQGRYCQRQLARVLQAAGGVAADACPPFEAQVPVKPISVGALAREKPEWAGYRRIEGEFAPRMQVSAAATPELEAEVLVIGAGIIGLCTALHLAEAGVDVLVVDSSDPFAQASGNNAGSLHLQMLSSDFDNPAVGASAASQAIGLQRMGIAEWQALASRLSADFEIQITGGLVVAGSEAELAFLRRKVSVEQAQGLEVDMLCQSELREKLEVVSPRMLGAAWCPGEGKINPLTAGPVLRRALQAAGGRLLVPCAVSSIGLMDGTYHVGTSAARIRCDRMVNAAGGWTAGIAGLVGASLPVHTAPQQMIVTEPLAPMIGQLVAAS
ncbi:MAG: FAD-dependent oxidoreductase, partial [Chromatocurvus sp.]